MFDANFTNFREWNSGWTEIGWRNKIAAMTPGVLNKICAYPVIISWVLGACALNVIVVASISQGMPLSTMISDWETMKILVLAIFPLSGLGFFLGMFICWPLVRVLCSRYNGAPLKVGDHVLILAGPDKGKNAEVYEITIGQGKWELARLNLGPERSEKFRDIFEEYSLFKLKTHS